MPLSARLGSASRAALAGLLLLAILPACRSQSAGATVLPMAMPATTPTPASPPPPPPPPPPPKCESLSEGCKADEKTRVEIADSDIAYSPPPGWSYETTPERSRTTETQGVAEVAFALAPSEEDAAVLETVEKLAASMALGNVKLDRLKKRLKKPQTTLEGESGAIELWEITAGTQGGKAPELPGKGKGTALLALARVATERLIIVLGFVVEPDEQGQAAKIMQSVQSLSVMK